MEVDAFLRDFLFNLEIWGLLIRTDRTNPRNIETLLALDLSRVQVKDILKLLRTEDYSQGPLPDKLYHQSPMWVFGKMVKGKEIYIKIQMGPPNSSTICISFHFSEFNMSYPFKK